MSRFLVDTNVVIDVMSRDSAWFQWSAETLELCADQGPLAINPIIYAELSAGFQRVEALEAALPPPDWQRLDLPWAAAFLAGRCFRDYRARGGQRQQTLPDFFIGAHAVLEGLTLVTRDPRRFRTYFPGLGLVCPS